MFRGEWAKTLLIAFILVLILRNAQAINTVMLRLGKFVDLNLQNLTGKQG